MPIYYLLHHILPESETFKDGKRNCATFLLGSMLYIIVYCVLCNVELRYGIAFEPVRRSLFLMWLADVSTMGYIYKSYYGRSIMHEINDVDQHDWVYDEVTHKYRRPTPFELELKAKAKAEAEAQDQGAEVLVTQDPTPKDI